MNEYLCPNNFQRIDETDDAIFYEHPRLVTHIDGPACDALRDYFREHLPPGGDLLDLMSSCVSHLPFNVSYQSVTGLGMNHVELTENSQLSRRLVHDLANNPSLPFGNNSFDGCMITVSVQYLIHPVKVFGEIARVLRPSRPCIVSFSNRCFPTKAVAIWHQLDNANHTKLVEHYFNESGGFQTPDMLDISPNPGKSDPLFVVSAKSRA